MTTLYLRENQITDISALGSLINLTTLYLRENQITDISALG
ncbi:leucine-rich repeat domain-containing protein, partial [Microcoleus sp. herbarium2]